MRALVQASPRLWDARCSNTTNFRCVFFAEINLASFPVLNDSDQPTLTSQSCSFTKSANFADFDVAPGRNPPSLLRDEPLSLSPNEALWFENQRQVFFMTWSSALDQFGWNSTKLDTSLSLHPSIQGHHRGRSPRVKYHYSRGLTLLWTCENTQHKCT